jgi:hypothetical protein
MTGPEALKQTLLEGTASFEEIAKALGIDVRTVYRLELPYIVVKRKRRAVIALAREKLMSRIKDPLASPRGRGRPRKAALPTT